MAIDVQHICGNCFQERTSQEGPCSMCGYDPMTDVEKYPMALPRGSILNGSYIIGRVLGQGGFGITYLAWDYSLKVRVAIKEYFPDGTVTRLRSTPLVSPVSQSAQEDFSYGVQRFLDEAEVLGKFLGNPNIVGVRSFFEENGTAYFTMEYVEGPSFQQYIKEHSGHVSWQEATGVLFPVMDALRTIHQEGIFHRDITPDNILLSQDGTVKLIDFGSARYSLGDSSHKLDVQFKEGYAPKEQYAGNGIQGPYTDVYSLAACFYAAITGYLPPESLQRMNEDMLIPPSGRGVLIPVELEHAILRGLSVYQQDRFQTVEDFRTALAPLHPEQYLKIWMPAQTPAIKKDSTRSAPPLPPTPDDQTLYNLHKTKTDSEQNTAKKKKTDTIKMWLRVCAGLAASVIITVILYSFWENRTQVSDSRQPVTPVIGNQTQSQTVQEQIPVSSNRIYLYSTDERCAKYAADCLMELGWQVDTIVVPAESFTQNLEYANMAKQSPVLAFGSEKAGEVLNNVEQLQPNNWGTAFYASGLENADAFLSVFETATADIHVKNEEFIYSSSGETAGFYTGYVTDHKCDGWGEMRYTNGDIYVGEWSANKRNGYGILTFANGDRYEGDFVENIRNGEGAYYWTDGRHYEGSFSDGVISGNGTMYYTDGNSKSGIWENGEFIG